VGNRTIIEQPPALSGPPDHPAAPEQLEIVASYATDELEGDGELAAIARFAAHLCETRVAGITVAGRQSDRFLAHHGSTLRKVSRNVAFSSFAMEGYELMQVFDAAAEPRFADNPNVLGPPHIRFFAGQPLISPEGVAFGALSVIDDKPRPGGLTELQREGLAVLAESVMLRLSGHRKQLALQRHSLVGHRRRRVRVLQQAHDRFHRGRGQQGRRRVPPR
jgi:GAF domain-containing protein